MIPPEVPGTFFSTTTIFQRNKRFLLLPVSERLAECTTTHSFYITLQYGVHLLLWQMSKCIFKIPSFRPWSRNSSPKRFLVPGETSFSGNVINSILLKDERVNRVHLQRALHFQLNMAQITISIKKQTICF